MAGTTTSLFDVNQTFVTNSTTFHTTETFVSELTTNSEVNTTIKDDLFCKGRENYYLDRFVDEILKQVLICLGIFINSIAIWILITHKKMQNMFLHLLACSMVADNGFLLMALTTTLFYEFKLNFLAWPVSYISIPFKEIFFTAGLLITVSMAYERYTTLDVGKGYRTRMKVKKFRHQRLMKYILFFCIFCPCFNIHVFFTHYVDYSLPRPLQRTDWWKSSWYRNFVEVKWLVTLGIAFIVLVILNYKVFTHVTKTIEKTSLFQMNEKDENPKSKRKFIQRLKRHEKLTFALFGIVILYFFCNTFYVVELSLKEGLKDCNPSYQKNYEVISRLLRVINACSNVIVYCVADRTFRRHIRFYLKRMFYPLFCKLIPVLEPTTVDEESQTGGDRRPSQASGDRRPSYQVGGDRRPSQATGDRTPDTPRRGVTSSQSRVSNTKEGFLAP